MIHEKYSCDRCGHSTDNHPANGREDGNDWEIIQRLGRGRQPTEEFHICPDCAPTVRRFLTSISE